MKRMVEEEKHNNSDVNSEMENKETIEKVNGTPIRRTHPNEKIMQKLIEDEMKKSYLDYSMSVIVGRALPDVRDGLKPVHRRVLFAMQQLGMFYNKAYKKSARIVGEVLGKFHPHGDAAVYETMVRMTQSFSLRYPLVDGQGNWGSIDGDRAASMRYTEARLTKIAEEVLVDIEKETVDFVDNFDGSLKEPTVLPGKLPNLLINGSSGIAVGMATNIPPHNITEAIDATVKLIDDTEISVEELMKVVSAPDFPTGGIICGRQGVRNAYKYGKGRIILRAKTEVEEKKNREYIIVNEIPYMVNKAQLIEQIAELVHDKKITGISDIRDESDRDGMRVVIEIKQGFSADIVLNQLYKHTRMQNTFGVIMLALVDNEPKILNLKQLLQNYIGHRKNVVRRRTEFELKKASERAHVLEGLIIALNNIDEIVKKIKASKTVEVATQMLVQDYSLTEIQAKAILDMKLQKLSSLEQEKIKQEHKELLQLIDTLKAILADENKILEIIKKELVELKEKYGDERKTEISNMEVKETALDIEDLIEEEKNVITITHKGYVKRLPVDTYKEQKRGGKGVIATATREEDWVEDVFVASTHSYILFFTNKGKVHWLKAYNVPEGSRQSRGKAIVNLIELEQGENVNAVVPVREFDEEHYLMLATKNGVVKKTNLMAYSRPRKGGIIGILLDERDELINAELTDGKREILLATKEGMAIRFNEMNVRPLGRSTRGVRGITLKENDSVVAMVIVSDKKAVLTVTENGYGKKTKVAEYRQINRGGMGVINIQTTERNGKVVAVHSMYDENDLMLVSKNGIMIRTNAKEISLIGRNTQGVRLMKLGSGDKVVSAAKIVKEKEEENKIKKQEKEIEKEVEEKLQGVKTEEELVAEQICEAPSKDATVDADVCKAVEDKGDYKKVKSPKSEEVPSIYELMKRKLMGKRF